MRKHVMGLFSLMVEYSSSQLDANFSEINNKWVTHLSYKSQVMVIDVDAFDGGLVGSHMQREPTKSTFGDGILKYDEVTLSDKYYLNCEAARDLA